MTDLAAVRQRAWKTRRAKYGLRGHSEKWPDMLFDMSGKEQPCLAKYELNEVEATLSLEKLMGKFPAPIQDLFQDNPVHFGSMSRSNGDVV